MVDEADKDGTGLLTEKEFMQSSATEVRKDIIKFIFLNRDGKRYRLCLNLNNIT